MQKNIKQRVCFVLSCDVLTHNKTKQNTHTLKAIGAEKHAEYVGLQDDTQRREWLASFILDPKSGGHVATNTTRRSESSTARSNKRWMTIEEYGGQNGINSMDHAKKRCLGGEFECRPHESRILAKDDIKQYLVTLDFGVDKKRSVTQEAQITHTAEVGEEDAGVVEQDLGDFAFVGKMSPSPPMQQGKQHEGPTGGRGKQGAGRNSRGKAKDSEQQQEEAEKLKEMSEEQRQQYKQKKMEQSTFTKSKEELDQILADMKSQSEKMSKDLDEELIIEKRLKERGPQFQQMKDFLVENQRNRKRLPATSIPHGPTRRRWSTQRLTTRPRATGLFRTRWLGPSSLSRRS